MFTIKYTFNDGTSCEVKVSEKIYIQHLILQRREHLSNRRETRRHNSLDKMLEIGDQFESLDSNPLLILIKQEDEEKLHKAMSYLLSPQRDLLDKIFFQDMTLTEIAKAEGVGKSAIANRLTRIYAQLKKLLKNF